MIQRSAFAVAVVLLAVAAAAPTQDQLSPTRSARLLAVEYGESMFASQFAFAEPYPEQYVRFGWLFYVLDSGDRRILIDTGFSSVAMARTFGVNLVDPLELLGSVGITPESVTDIILTHNHFDHADNVNRFPHATVYVNEREAQLLDRRAPSLLDPAREAGRLQLFTDRLKPLPGMLVRRIGGHTDGSCVVYLTVDNRNFVLTGDEVYLAQNISTGNPIGTYADLQAARAFTDEMRSSTATILTFHDPEIVPGTHGIRRIQ